MRIRCTLSWTITIFTLASGAFAQSKFYLANYYPPLLDAPVYDAQGVPLAGSIYRAELWGGLAPDALAPALLADRGFVRDFAPFTTDGHFATTAGSRNPWVTSENPGGFAWLQVRAWDTRLGSTWEEVAAVGMGGYGESTIFYARGADPFREPPVASDPLIGLQSFSLRPIPEPSTWMIGVLGLVSFWVLKRRNHR